MLKGAGRKPAALSRSNTTSSIRGKISSPMPLATIDDGFPVKTPGIGIATSLGHQGLENHLLPSFTPLPMDAAQQKEADISRNTPSAVPSVPLSPVPSHESLTHETRQVSQSQGLGAKDPSAPSIQKPQRKKSTLRSVLGRLFGKKRKSDSSINGVREGSAWPDPHHSDPSALRKPSGRTPQRSASMPMNDFNRALRSHSPFAEEKKSQASGNAQGSRDIDERTASRRSTTPNRPYEPTRTPGLTGLRPRPSSSHARGSETFTNADVHSPVGFAVTSSTHPNRRSRSVGHLRDAAAQQEMRRRSDEIRYWRESYPSCDPDAQSPMSSQHKPEMDSRQATQEDVTSQASKTADIQQPFNFWPLSEMAGMKITQAASLSARVSALEARLDRMEEAVASVQDRISGSLLPLRDAPEGRLRTDSYGQSLPRNAPKKTYQQAHNSQEDVSFSIQNHSYESSRPSSTSTQPSEKQLFEKTPPRPTSLSSPETTSEVPLPGHVLSTQRSEQMGRPASTSTITHDVAFSSPVGTPDRTVPLSKNDSLTAHHYRALLNLITAEQSARRRLETQVASLQQQLQSLLSSYGDGTIVGYSMPQSDQLPSPKTMGTENFLGLEPEDSGTESEAEINSDRREEVYFTSEEYEDELVGMQTRGKPRTLSLSQLTMRNSALTGVAF